ncbi:MAG: hypothetical protein HW405_139 [Candidatus Berkelbacteria bacterium]|nr:hypothetical protein [Candidatus Berkelbacteria bacterium]
MVAVTNIEHFLNQHPEFEDQREAILKKANELAEGGLISGEDVPAILGVVHAHLLFEEVCEAEHLRLFGEAIENSPLRGENWSVQRPHQP